MLTDTLLKQYTIKSSPLLSSPLLSSPLTDFEPQRGMDRYLDSLFDPVLSDGTGVSYIIHSD